VIDKEREAELNLRAGTEKEDVFLMHKFTAT
jgi:hypothetical protein